MTPRHTYGQTYTPDQLAHADAVRRARAAGRVFHWVALTAPHPEPTAAGYRTVPSWSAYARLAYLPGDIVWTARTGWIGTTRMEINESQTRDS